MSDLAYLSLSIYSEKEEEMLKSVPKDPISQYNEFIQIYNTPCNLVDEIQLDPIPVNAIFKKFYPYGSKWVYGGRYAFFSIFLLILYAINYYSKSVTAVVLGFVLIGINLSHIAFVGWKIKQGDKIRQTNRQQVADPFENMMFNPGICRMKKTCCVHLVINVKELDDYPLTRPQREGLKKIAFNDSVEFTAYNHIFTTMENAFQYPYMNLLIFDFSVNLTSSLMIYMLIVLDHISN